ncbi:MAG: DOMON-like domain-containing protein [Gammaproteobacteria bacterium]|nr:DOMON-like domain-containing protein [Gammaproteobacteria bacterium]
MNRIPFALQPFAAGNRKNLPVSLAGSLLLRNNKISIWYRLTGDINVINFPDISLRPSRKDQLWHSTCFELFAGPAGQPGYWEYNLSPSHDWAVFGFTDYRQNKTDEPAISEIDVNTAFDNGREFNLNTILTLPDALAGHRLDIGISSVIQDKMGNLYYYALSHAGEQPDFHNRNCFTIYINTDKLIK